MRYNRLGATELFVSELAFGIMTFSASGPFEVMEPVQQAEADALLARAIEARIHLIDTAETSSGGTSERITGQALKNLGMQGENVIVATRAGRG